MKDDFDIDGKVSKAVARRDGLLDPSKPSNWLRELESARKREKKWRASAKKLVEMYECTEKERDRFNILYSNTETLLPAVYNNTPRPVVDRRFRDADPIGKVAAQVIQRSLEFALDNDVKSYPSFDELMQSAVLDALVPGRGLTRFKYDATFVEIEPPQGPKGDAAAEETSSETPAQEAAERVDYEAVCGENVAWDRVLFGYAKTWDCVPWEAFEHFLTREEAVSQFGEKAATIELTIEGSEDNRQTSDNTTESASRPQDASGAKFMHLWEIWDRTTKKVYFYAPADPDNYLKVVDDPLQLTGFFPNPAPLQLFAKISSMVPVPLYRAYESQAKELNLVDTRISKLIEMLKVRGFYDGTLEGIKDVLTASDGDLIPAPNVAALQQGMSLEKSIFLMPLQEVVVVLQNLYNQREQIKTVIYEITGISDILRGASVASETATAQNIKNQWGTLRLKRMQKRVMTYVRDCLRLQAEIICTKMGYETLQGMTGLRFPTEQEKIQAQQIMQAQQAQAQAQPPQPGQPPQEPQVPPEVQQALALPSWEEIMKILSNDVLRSYKIDVETNSTVDTEATEDKANISEFLNAIAQFLNGVAPMVEQGILPFDAAKSILLAVTRKYRFGVEVEDQIDAMKAPDPAAKEDPGAAAAKQKAELDVQLAQMNMQHQQAMQQQESQLAQQTAAMDAQKLQLDMEMRQAEHQMKMQELARKAEVGNSQHAMKMAEIEAKAAQAAATRGMSDAAV
jgi:hypothetical protein